MPDRQYEIEKTCETSDQLVYFINDNNLRGCPQLELNFAGKRITAVIDSGAEVSIVSEELFNELEQMGVKILHVPVINGVLISAWRTRSKKIKRQALIKFQVEKDNYEQVFMVAPNLLTHVILGANFLNENDALLNFREGCIVMREGSVSRRHNFFFWRPNQRTDEKRGTV